MQTCNPPFPPCPALPAQKLLPVATHVPSSRQLAAIAAASGLPFVGFGIVDNAVMLLAGEQIDMAFGASLGLTTLASAALGNLVADVVGVSVTHQVQENMRKIMNPPHLSKPQQVWRSRLHGRQGCPVPCCCVLAVCTPAPKQRQPSWQKQPVRPVGVPVSCSRQRLWPQLPARLTKDSGLPGLSPVYLQGLPAVKWAQLLGAVVGVSIGCLLGMAPLGVMSPGIFDPQRQAAAAAAVAAAAAGAES